MNHIQKSSKLQTVSVTSPLTFAAPGQGKHNCVNAITVDSDAAANVTIESPSGTVLWRSKIQANTGIEKTWPDSDPIIGAENQALIVTCSAGTVNISAGGFVTP